MLLSISKDVMQALCRFRDRHANLVCFLFKSIVCFISDHSTILNKIIFYLVESFVSMNIIFLLRGVWTRTTNPPRSSWCVISSGFGAGKSKVFYNLSVTLRSTFLWSSIWFKVYPFTNLQVLIPGRVFIRHRQGSYRTSQLCGKRMSHLFQCKWNFWLAKFATELEAVIKTIQLCFPDFKISHIPKAQNGISNSLAKIAKCFHKESYVLLVVLF